MRERDRELWTRIIVGVGCKCWCEHGLRGVRVVWIAQNWRACCGSMRPRGGVRGGGVWGVSLARVGSRCACTWYAWGVLCACGFRVVCGDGRARAGALAPHHKMLGGAEGRSNREGEDDDLALIPVLHAGFAVRLEARERRERDLLLPRVLPRHPSV